MTRNKFRLLLLAGLFGASLGAAADATLDQARQLLNDRRAAAAYELLAPFEDERAGTPDYDFLLGLSALDAGHAGEAVFALERVLAVDPNHSLARAEIARAYYALSELETAKQEIKNVMQADDVPDSARATMDQYLSLIERAQSGRRVSGFLTVGGGYDTNVNSGTDQSQVAIPLFNNAVFQLNDQAQSFEHGFGLVAGGADISQPLNETWSAVGGARGYYRHTESPFSTRDIYLYGGVRADRGRHQFTAAAQGENFAIDGESLRYVYGGFGQWTYAVDNRSRLSLSAQVSQIDYPDLPNRDAMRYVGALGYLIAIGGKREPVLYAGAYGGVEEEDRNAFQQFGHDLFGGRIGGSLELCARTRGFASASFEQRDYHGDDPIFLRTRDDTQYMLTGGVEFTPEENWQVKPYVSYTNTDSNIPINDYDRVIGGVDLTMRF
jgi:tetratricopeptide (TPR) repeat protein